MVLVGLSRLANVQFLGTETRALPSSATRNGDKELALTFDHYAFTLDSDAYGQYMRDHLESRMRTSGELPPNVGIGIPEIYEKSSGQGKIWITSDGLPARLTTDLHLPPTRHSLPDTF